MDDGPTVDAAKRDAPASTLGTPQGHEPTVYAKKHRCALSTEYRPPLGPDITSVFCVRHRRWESIGDAGAHDVPTAQAGPDPVSGDPG